MTTPLHAEPVVTVLNTTFHGNNLDGEPVIGGGPDGQTRLTLIGWTCFGPDEAGQAALYAAAPPAPAVARERVPGCVCTFVGEWDGYSGVVAHHSGPWPVWIDKSCPVHGAAPTQGGGQLSGNTGELAEAVEIVTEWLAMAEAVPTQTHGVLRYPPISQGELDAIAILAKGDSHE